ncbi:BET1-like protein [Aplysia californica]|uniref:BET1-like protein n=1 Tax=Aplysia californica TaxID=6500 RepID=A0ABM1A718_APLCA|nr:BET1-like protein [Aplysia californica]
MADWRNKTRNGGMSTEEMLDQENQMRVGGLASKVSLLKGIALDIEGESKSSNRYLDGVAGDFGSSEGLLSGSMNRLSNMVSSGKGNRKVMCYIILGLVLLFVVFYYFIMRITGGRGGRVEDFVLPNHTETLMLGASQNSSSAHTHPT